VNFEAYLVSKKIDSDAFKQGEKDLWLSWQTEFEQLHPNSFTAQKLYIINPVRRKYPLKVELKKEVAEAKNQEQLETSNSKLETSPKEPGTLNLEPGTSEAKPSKPAVPRPVFKQPKPKIN
jgi:hypothetical protein